MIRIQKILCPVDFYPASERAADYAVALAQNYGSRLTLLHVVPAILPTAYGVRVDLKKLAEAVKEKSVLQLEGLARKAEKAKVPVECIVRAGDAGRWIRRIVKSGNIDLVVMGTHGRRGVERWVLGSVAEQMLRSIKTPVLTIGRTKKPERAPAAIRRILVTTDFSEGTTEAMAHAFSIAQECQARISLLHVLGASGANMADEYREILIREIGDQLERLIPDEARLWCRVKTRVEAGVPANVILDVLEHEHIDLLVMNVHVKRRPGSTAERVVRAATCPVLMIPSRAAAQGKRRPARRVA